MLRPGFAPFRPQVLCARIPRPREGGRWQKNRRVNLRIQPPYHGPRDGRCAPRPLSNQILTAVELAC
jgi:hypothetical protein